MNNFAKLFFSLQFPPKKAPHKKLPKLDLIDVSALYIHRLNRFGYSQYKNWLHADSKRRLIFLEKDHGVIHSCLNEEMLQDPQVLIEEGDELAPFDKVEVIGPPKVRLAVLQKTLFANSLRLDRLHGDLLFANFIRNLPHIGRSFYANDLKDSYRNLPAIICGAGPSLEKTIPHLNNALLIAGGSTIAALHHFGVTPHFGMAIDPNLEEYHRLQSCLTMPLLYSTRVHPDVLNSAKGPLLYMRTGIGALPELWLEEELGLTSPFIGHDLSTDAMSVTTVCIAFAHFLGCNPICLNGIDLAYKNSKRYAGITPANVSAVEPIRYKGVQTALHWTLESKAISDFVKNHPETRFIDTTGEGLGFDNVEHIPLQKLALKAKIPPIRFSPMTKLPIPIDDLRSSLDRVIAHLSAPNALAQLELQEELATAVLFHDIRKLFPQDLYPNWLTLAKKYRSAFCA